MNEIPDLTHWNKIYLSSVPSTNDYALEFIRKNEMSNWHVIYSFHQTEGKGHFGRKWLGEPNVNIYLSLILDISFIPIGRLFQFNMAMAMAVKSFFEKHVNKKVFLKWPNDIYVEGKKIAGILIQNSISGKSLKYSVIGVGLNINQTNFPDNLINAISVSQITGETYELEKLLDEFLIEVDKYYEFLKSGFYDLIFQLYQSSLFRQGEKTKFRLKNGNLIEGIIDSVNSNGQLNVLIDRKVWFYNHGEIEYIL